MNDRISWDSYFMGIAKLVRERSEDPCCKVGACIVKDNKIISTGYNGAPRGETNCCERGECWRALNNIPHGEKYEACVSVHAEQNAIISASRSEMIGATLYLVGFEDGRKMSPEDVKPCDICRRLIKNAGILRVITDEEDKLA